MKIPIEKHRSLKSRKKQKAPTIQQHKNKKRTRIKEKEKETSTQKRSTKQTNKQEQAIKQKKREQTRRAGNTKGAGFSGLFLTGGA